GPEDGWLASRIRKRYRPAPLMSSREHAFPMLKTRRLPRPAPLAAALLLCAAPAAAQGAGADTAGRSIPLVVPWRDATTLEGARALLRGDTAETGLIRAAHVHPPPPSPGEDAPRWRIVTPEALGIW